MKRTGSRCQALDLSLGLNDLLGLFQGAMELKLNQGNGVSRLTSLLGSNLFTLPHLNMPGIRSAAAVPSNGLPCNPMQRTLTD
jgi:hypothetical protein